ncbi:MAG: tetratricopeptide repeat protein [Planctomycetes bacterium]|nr:tetratricopeptide repeat protein [Planctomycetota bacterium]
MRIRFAAPMLCLALFAPTPAFVAQAEPEQELPEQAEKAETTERLVEIVLQDGTRVEGRLLEFGKRIYHVRIGTRVLEIPESQVAEVRFNRAGGGGGGAGSGGAAAGPATSAPAAVTVPGTEAGPGEITRLALEALLEADYERAIATDPADARAWLGKGVVLNYRGNFAEGLRAFEKALELAPEHAEAWRGKANSLMNLERFEEALRAADEALRLDPNDAQSLSLRAEALRRLDRQDEAAAALARAAELAKSRGVKAGPASAAGARTRAAAALEVLGKKIEKEKADPTRPVEEALQAYEEALRLEPRSTVGSYREALEELDRALRLTPGDAAGWFQRANALRNVDRREEARRAFEKALEAFETAEKSGASGPADFATRARILRELGRGEESRAFFEKAREYFQQAEENGLATARDLLARAEVLKELGRGEEAAREYKRAIESDARGWRDLAQAGRGAGRGPVAGLDLDAGRSALPGTRPSLREQVRSSFFGARTLPLAERWRFEDPGVVGVFTGRLSDDVARGVEVLAMGLEGPLDAGVAAANARTKRASYCKLLAADGKARGRLGSAKSPRPDEFPLLALGKAYKTRSGSVALGGLPNFMYGSARAYSLLGEKLLDVTPGGGGLAGAELVDVDGDGELDVVACEYGGDLTAATAAGKRLWSVGKGYFACATGRLGAETTFFAARGWADTEGRAGAVDFVDRQGRVAGTFDTAGTGMNGGGIGFKAVVAVDPPGASGSLVVAGGSLGTGFDPSDVLVAFEPGRRESWRFVLPNGFILRQPNCLAAGDLDGDGVPEVVVALSPGILTRENSKVLDCFLCVLSLDGKPLWISDAIQNAGWVTMGSFAAGLEVRDLDGDGKGELVLGVMNQGVRVYGLAAPGSIARGPAAGTEAAATGATPGPITGSTPGPADPAAAAAGAAAATATTGSTTEAGRPPNPERRSTRIDEEGAARTRIVARIGQSGMLLIAPLAADGGADLPYIGRVKDGHAPAPALRAELERRYRERFADPALTVEMTGRTTENSALEVGGARLPEAGVLRLQVFGRPDLRADYETRVDDKGWVYLTENGRSAGYKGLSWLGLLTSFRPFADELAHGRTVWAREVRGPVLPRVSMVSVLDELVTALHGDEQALSSLGSVKLTADKFLLDGSLPDLACVSRLEERLNATGRLSMSVREARPMPAKKDGPEEVHYTIEGKLSAKALDWIGAEHGRRNAAPVVRFEMSKLLASVNGVVAGQKVRLGSVRGDDSPDGGRALVDLEGDTIASLVEALKRLDGGGRNTIVTRLELRALPGRGAPGKGEVVWDAECELRIGYPIDPLDDDEAVAAPGGSGGAGGK